MDFGLSQDQQMLRDAVARCLADTCPLDHVRECAERDNPLSDKVLRAVQDLGIPGMLVPEEHGGLGMTLLDAAIVAEQLAYAVAPVPFLASHVLAPIALSEAGSEEQKAQWLPKIASGEARIAVAISETIEARDGAVVSSADGRLNGTALFCLDFEGADAYIVADAGGRLHLAAADAFRLETIPLTTIDRTRSVGELRFGGTEAELLADDNGTTTARLRDAGRVILAADSLGAGQAMIEKAVDYSGQREQFGRLIGSFQAVKHMCAEMAARHEPCRSLVWYAAHAFGAMPEDVSLVACHAKSHTGEVHRFVARTSTEVHGGMGFTDLIGLHYWFKRIGFDRQVLGGPETVRAEAAALQGWIKAA
ncbi:MAG: acyl-CoA dehydrogenase [Hyphomonas sp. BRH_c22]|jgi:alkylation response protein AidB-like acyl-CoA dehydrogenase|uniref:Acyl-CoA dehydrogenase n=1 Tax=Hyphomonas chukchiensis TaxID=1280947 RepID=A0A062UI05_9PROT|nr:MULTISPECIES: acyl-CoA dehydrogenase family protein [Hyphomonas]KCZ56179.1 acyl-CoA dehydrogenase [Hyphomonas chukchiensis]KJS39790.1 MAG: acyl-CoA dehydrogenase [Hyphomonas sp. BRH_c22]MBR9806459.1 acyl-CoA/acyl-ACP dehydrogenase [Alphaproteobacteria bacterium]|tara:strand:+ start:126 stop:1217 length:1092 start_codon:yes stop_codon:yes gene_type:complete